MNKRGLKSLALFKVFLLISMSFAIAFILNSEFVVVTAQVVISGTESDIFDIFKGFLEGIMEKVYASQVPPPPPAIPLERISSPAASAPSPVPSAAPAPPASPPADSAPPTSAPAAPGDGAGAAKGGGFFDIIQNILGGHAGTGSIIVDALISGIAWAGISYLAGKYVFGKLFGLNKEQSNALGYSMAAGGFTGSTLYTLLTQIWAKSWSGLGSFSLSAVAGLLVAAAVFLLTYKEEKKYVISIECLPYESPLGGKKCEECNKDPFRPCSEYRCKSLGQACQIINAGTEEEKCVWVNPHDVNSPVMEPWKDALKPTGLNLRYVPDNAIRPPNKGVKIVSNLPSGCLPPFTPLEFGITLNEPASCRLDYNMTYKYDEMMFSFGGSNFLRYNHTQKMKLPGPPEQGQEEIPVLQNKGTYSLFVRCRDANGNENVDAFAFTFCVDPSPDTTPPIIQGFSIQDNVYIRYNANTVPIEVYINEPAECKWSRQNKNYNDMENTMTCFTEQYQINADLNYVCIGNLTGIANLQENKFYFRCKDQPDKPDKDRNVMTDSKELVLKGTQELNIIEVSPNGTVYGSTDFVEVNLYLKTDDGAEEGRAVCYLSSSDNEDSYISMAETLNYEHKQILYLPQGNYTYFFKCVDMGGNSDKATTTFRIEVDKSPPRVTRAYKEETLKIITNEDAECVYSMNSCNYASEEGLKMSYSNPDIRTIHYTPEWKDNIVYYIKCKDFYGNEPNPNECTIIIRSIELAEA